MQSLPGSAYGNLYVQIAYDQRWLAYYSMIYRYFNNHQDFSVSHTKRSRALKPLLWLCGVSSYASQLSRFISACCLPLETVAHLGRHIREVLSLFISGIIFNTDNWLAYVISIQIGLKEHLLLIPLLCVSGCY